MFAPPEDVQPPAIVLEWSSARNAWTATPVIAWDGARLGVEGEATTEGTSPPMALDNLLGRAFGALTASDCPATMISIDREKQPS